eukprot:gene8423-1504_t
MGDEAARWNDYAVRKARITQAYDDPQQDIYDKMEARQHSHKGGIGSTGADIKTAQSAHKSSTRFVKGAALGADDSESEDDGFCRPSSGHVGPRDRAYFDKYYQRQTEDPAKACRQRQHDKEVQEAAAKTRETNTRQALEELEDDLPDEAGSHNDPGEAQDVGVSRDTSRRQGWNQAKRRMAEGPRETPEEKSRRFQVERWQREDEQEAQLAQTETIEQRKLRWKKEEQEQRQETFRALEKERQEQGQNEDDLILLVNKPEELPGWLNMSSGEKAKLKLGWKKRCAEALKRRDTADKAERSHKEKLKEAAQKQDRQDRERAQAKEDKEYRHLLDKIE